MWTKVWPWILNETNLYLPTGVTVCKLEDMYIPTPATKTDCQSGIENFDNEGGINIARSLVFTKIRARKAPRLVSDCGYFVVLIDSTIQGSEHLPIGTDDSKTTSPTFDHLPTGSRLTPRFMSAWKDRKWVTQINQLETLGEVIVKNRESTLSESYSRFCYISILMWISEQQVIKRDNL